jgi:hypothetical protein
LSRRLSAPEKWWTKKEAGRDRAREREREREREKERASERTGGSISGIAILLLAPLLIAGPLKIMNVNYA